MTDNAELVKAVQELAALVKDQTAAIRTASDRLEAVIEAKTDELVERLAVLPEEIASAMFQAG